MTRGIFAAICLASVLAAMPASAVIITFDYSAAQTSGPGVVSGQFGYDTTVADEFPLNPNLGRYAGAFWSGAVSGGPQDGANFSFVNMLARVNEGGGDFFQFEGGGLLGTFFNLNNFTDTAFSDDSLPLDLDLSDFPIAGLFLFGSDVGVAGGQVEYEFTSIEQAYLDNPEGPPLDATGPIGDWTIAEPDSWVRLLSTVPETTTTAPKLSPLTQADGSSRRRHSAPPAAQPETASSQQAQARYSPP